MLDSRGSPPLPNLICLNQILLKVPASRKCGIFIFLFSFGLVESVNEKEEDNQNIPLIPSRSEGEIIELERDIVERSNEEENEKSIKQEENKKQKIIKEYPEIERFLEDPKKLEILIKKNKEMEDKILEIKNPFASINLKAVGIEHAVLVF
uniref:Uncharacterized protein n=1 Tax=Meloidogyne enterolobii TaxID=390850 RepID=A0A6V7TYV6_MELEN|nr:unnamed protein product [Meloidogyne enterolobii]